MPYPVAFQMEGNIEDSGVFLAGRYRGQESISTLSFSPQGIAAATHVQQVGKGKGAFCTELEVDLRKVIIILVFSVSLFVPI